MATHKLLLLPGDGIGPEVMAEVKRLIDWLDAAGIAHFATEQGLVGGSAYDASRQSITDATMAQAMAADAVIFGAVGGPKWDSVPYDARPEAGLAAAAQGTRAVRQSAPGGVLSGAGGSLQPEARGGRGPRHHDRARAHRRGLFRRAEDHHRPRQRPEARHRHPGLRHLRDRAHRPGRVRPGAKTPQQADLDGKAQRHEVGRALERGGDAGAWPRIQGRARSNTSSPIPAG